jgi:hypothetical protein
VKALSIPRRFRALRWLVPVVALGLVSVGGLAATGAFTSARASSETLPDTTPAALVAAVDSAKVSGFSGTIVARMSLGLPDVGPLAGDRDDQSMASLLSGSHTLRLWYGGPERQRIALLGATSEADLFRSGDEVWEWNSTTRVAVHRHIDALRAAGGPAPSPTASLPRLAPAELAQRLLDAIGPSTAVDVGPGPVVAGRATYELTLTPRTSQTRVGSVRIDVDGTAKVPVAVRVYARGHSAPSIDIAFTSVTFKMPSANYFEFSPPPGATVHRAGAGTPPPHPRALAQPERSATAPGHGDALALSTSGQGWTRLVQYQLTAAQRRAMSEVLDQLPIVSGSWGRGRLLTSPLLCALVTDTGQVFAGAVDPAALYAAALADR